MFLQLIAGSDEKYNKKESSHKYLRSVGRLPKKSGKLSPTMSAALHNF